MNGSELIEQIRGQRILVVGDLMLDRYWSGDTDRLSPEAPVPVVRVREVKELLGGAGNVALNLSAIGVGSIGLLGVVGADPAGERLRELLVENGITPHLVEDSGSPTVTKVRIISRQQQVTRLDFEEMFSAETSRAVVARYREIVADYDTVIFSDYAKGALGGIEEMLADRMGEGLRLVDPKNRDFRRYRGADWITPNWSEFIAAGGSDADEKTIEDQARRLLEGAGIGQMLLTRGEQGLSWINRSGKQDFPANVAKVHDVTGAGDTVIAIFTAALGATLDPAEAARLANRAAGIVVGRLGAAQISAEELRMLHHEAPPPKPLVKAFKPEVAIEAIAAAKRGGARIVFTNGCFDILHFGHVRLLQQARAFGDRLVVGLNRDESVRRLKGSSRPINGLAERAAVLLALEAVDWVIPFGEAHDDTPLALIQQLAPDVLVKGGDYTVGTIVGAPEVSAAGGRVEIIPLEESFSTTAIIARGQG